MASPSLDSFRNLVKNMKKMMRGNPALLEFVADLHIARRRLRQFAKAIGVGHFRAYARPSPDESTRWLPV
jgi:hypothetical protein